MEIMTNEDFEKGYYDGFSEVIQESGSEEAIIKKAVQEASKTYSNKEIAKIMRELFKKLGYGTQELSIKISRGTAIYVKIKTYKASLDKDFIETTANRFKRVDYDKYSGEILAGGNLFVFTDIDDSVKQQVAKELKPIAEELDLKLEKENPERGHGVLGFETKKGLKVWIFITGYQSHKLSIGYGKSINDDIHCGSILDGLVTLVLNQKRFDISLNDIMTANFKV